jgi:hypothetical protein
MILRILLATSLFSLTLVNSQVLTLKSQKTLENIIERQSEIPENRWFPLEEVDGTHSYFDSKGTIRLVTPYKNAGFFNDNRAYFKENGKFGYIDRTGKVVIKPQWNGVNNFDQQVAVVIMNNKSGVINLNGQLIIPCEYDSIEPLMNPFSEGLAIAYKNDKCGYLNLAGELAIPNNYYRCREFSPDGLAAVQLEKFQNGNKENEGNYGFINRSGKLIIDYRFGAANSFINGYAQVWKPGDNPSYMPNLLIDTVGNTYERNREDNMIYMTDLDGNTYRVNENLERVD